MYRNLPWFCVESVVALRCFKVECGLLPHGTWSRIHSVIAASITNTTDEREQPQDPTAPSEFEVGTPLEPTWNDNLIRVPKAMAWDLPPSAGGTRFARALYIGHLNSCSCMELSPSAAGRGKLQGTSGRPPWCRQRSALPALQWARSSRNGPRSCPEGRCSNLTRACFRIQLCFSQGVEGLHLWHMPVTVVLEELIPEFSPFAAGPAVVVVQCPL